MHIVIESDMVNGRDYIELVRQARFGERDSLDNLAELFRGPEGGSFEF